MNLLPDILTIRQLRPILAKCQKREPATALHACNFQEENDVVMFP